MYPDEEQKAPGRPLSTRALIIIMVVALVLIVLLALAFSPISKLISSNNAESLLASWDMYSTANFISSNKDSYLYIVPDGGTMQSAFGLEQEGDVGIAMEGLNAETGEALTAMFSVTFDSISENSNIQPLGCSFYLVSQPELLDEETRSGLFKYDGRQIMLIIDGFPYAVTSSDFAKLFDTVRIGLEGDAYKFFPWLEDK